MTSQRIPLTVLGGFLGAGKTTLLNRMLQGAGGKRLAVLVNDFGAINIDTALVAATTGDTIALTNGCVCCSIGDDLSGALIRVLAASPSFDAVVIEASGVSDPWRIAQLGLADPGLSLDGVIVLVDASAVLDQARDPLLADSLQRQLKAADLIVINKTDLANDDERRQVRDWIASVAGRTPVFETSQAAVPLPLLTGAALPAVVPTDTAHGCDHAHHDHTHEHEHGELFDTWSQRPDAVLSAQALRALLRDMPAGVLRLKGIVRTDEHGWAEVQFAGRHGSLRKAAAEPEDGAALVAIGLRGRLPAPVLDRLLSSSVLTPRGSG
ncbi:MAG: CobW family GTP-binding protein [Burkholderiaceae bacterium]